MAEERRVVVVTGAGAGIGRAVVESLLAANDQHVVAVDRDAEALARLSVDAPPRVSAEIVDVGDRAALAALGGRIEETYGHVDGLVCAAGLQRYGTVVDTPDEVFDEIVAVNIGGVFFACRALVPLMRRGGSVVVVSSVQAYAAQDSVAAYAMGKGALLSLVRAMAVDHAAAGIRVNAVCPGSVDTPMLRGAAELFGGERSTDDVIAEWGTAHALGRVAQPAEIAQAVSFLLDERASFITGADLRVDGGMLARLPAALPAKD